MFALMNRIIEYWYLAQKWPMWKQPHLAFIQNSRATYILIRYSGSLREQPQPGSFTMFGWRFYIVSELKSTNYRFVGPLIPRWNSNFLIVKTFVTTSLQFTDNSRFILWHGSRVSVLEEACSIEAKAHYKEEEGEEPVTVTPKLGAA